MDWSADQAEGSATWSAYLKHPFVFVNSAGPQTPEMNFALADMMAAPGFQCVSGVISKPSPSSSLQKHACFLRERIAQNASGGQLCFWKLACKRGMCDSPNPPVLGGESWEHGWFTNSTAMSVAFVSQLLMLRLVFPKAQESMTSPEQECSSCTGSSCRSARPGLSSLPEGGLVLAEGGKPQFLELLGLPGEKCAGVLNQWSRNSISSAASGAHPSLLSAGYPAA